MAVREEIETKSKWCPYCKGTHLHIYVKKQWKCMACKKVHDGISFHELKRREACTA